MQIPFSHKNGLSGKGKCLKGGYTPIAGRCNQHLGDTIKTILLVKFTA